MMQFPMLQLLLERAGAQPGEAMHGARLLDYAVVTPADGYHVVKIILAVAHHCSGRDATRTLGARGDLNLRGTRACTLPAYRPGARSSSLCRYEVWF